MNYYCPHCEREVEDFDFECDVFTTATGYGTYNPDSGYTVCDISDGDSEHENYNVLCPHCERELSEEEITKYAKEREQEEDLEELLENTAEHLIESPEATCVSHKVDIFDERDNITNMYRCSHCGNTEEMATWDEKFLCTECGSQLTRSRHLIRV